MKWKKFTLTTTTEAVDLISYTLDELGIEGIEIEDNIPLTEKETKGMFIDILPELPPDEGVAKVSFYLDEDDDIPAMMAKVKEALEELKPFTDLGACTFAESETEDKDWINMDTKLIVSASPHLRSEETTQSLMANVIVALCPCVVASAIIFGARALLVTAVSVVACVAFEWLYCKLLKKANPISDLSAVVTGIILAMNVPVGMPIGQLIIGDLVAIIVVKQLFGGIGMNFANPALVGRIVLFISFAGSMNNWVFPDAAVDQLSSATPLAVADTSKLSLLDLFMGVHGGVLGETCALAILLGLIYMVATKTISIAIPASYIGSMFIFYLISTGSLHGALVGILSGGLMFGAVFMATDYVTSPFTLKGKLIYGLCLGIVTFAIRQWGSYAEGVSFALLFMNLWVPFINDWTRQTPYGYVKPAKKAKEGAGK